MLLSELIHNEVVPHLQNALQIMLPGKDIEIVVDESGEQVNVYYPSLFNHEFTYLREHVLLEFGIRNETEPHKKHIIKPYLADCIDRNIIIPRPTVDTLSPIRTFWEKATLIHVECHRTKIKNSPDRLFRHWYDLFVLNHSWVGEEALRSKDILDKVIRHKKAFYHSSYAHYDKCLQGLFCIIPENDSLESLEKDYRGMTNSGMFLNEPPAFPEIIAYLREFETKINEIFNPRNDPEQHRAKIPTKAEIS